LLQYNSSFSDRCRLVVFIRIGAGIVVVDDCQDVV
jgi:hypothetical protein